MENEVSGIAKLGIVLIALAILIGLGFGIFQISKSVANDGVGQVQGELDSVGASKYSTYDQKNITGTMVTSALADFEGENTAVLIATQAWKDACSGKTESGTKPTPQTMTKTVLLEAGNTSGMGHLTESIGAYGTGLTSLPLVKATGSATADTTSADYVDLGWKPTKSGMTGVYECFINYNALLGALGSNAGAGIDEMNKKPAEVKEGIKMGYIYFDRNCYKYTGPFATDASGKVVFNNIITNVSKSGMTEYISSAAKFSSNLIKDNSGTTMGIAMEQIGG